MVSIIDLAIQHHREGRLPEALEIYEMILSTDPDPGSDVLYFAGMAYLATNRPQQAELHLAQAAAVAPARSEFHAAHGNALATLGRHEEALAAFRRATAIAPDSAALWFNLGNAARTCGLPDEAAAAFRTALTIEPGLKQALTHLGKTLLDSARVTDFCHLLEEVYATPALNDSFVDLARIGILKTIFSEESGLAETLRDMFAQHSGDSRLAWMLGYRAFLRRDNATAETMLEQALTHSPPAAEPKFLLGILLAARGAAHRAIPYLAIGDSDAEVDELSALADLFLSFSNPDEPRLGLLRAIMDANPGRWRMLHYVLFQMMGLGRHDASIALLTTLMGLAGLSPRMIEDPSLRETQDRLALDYFTHVTKSYAAGDYISFLILSVILMNRNDLHGAVHAAARAADLRPNDIEVTLMLARLTARLDMAAAIRILEAALLRIANAPELMNYLGNLHMRVGNMAAAMHHHDRARHHITPDEGEKFEWQLLTSNYRDDLAPETVSAMHFAWGNAVVARQASYAVPHKVPLEPQPRLRVGYVSGDYKSTSPSYFMLPLLASHDRRKIEIFCYATQEKNDETTPVFQQIASHWRDASILTDDQLAETIREDGIHILVDLCGHTMGSRMKIFARKPAPVQVTWLGYPNTTGLKTIDYRFTDALADPPGLTEAYHSETLYRLPHFLCYQPPDRTPDVAPPPVAANGFITFGCFNNSNKITDRVIETWVSILNNVPRSRLILKTAELADEKTAEAFTAKFVAAGLDAARLECYPSVPSKFDHLMIYGEIDLALDPFPYNGTTTTFEALWMGVPMVTLEGKVHAARVGLSIMAGMGLPELVASTIPGYIDMATSLAHDPGRLAAYRQSMRERLRTSPLMDARGFTASVEEAYCAMWNTAIATEKQTLCANMEGHR